MKVRTKVIAGLYIAITAITLLIAILTPSPGESVFPTVIYGTAIVIGWVGMLLKVTRVHAWWLLLGLLLFVLAYATLGPDGLLRRRTEFVEFFVAQLVFWTGIPLAALLTDRPGQWNREANESA